MSITPTRPTAQGWTGAGRVDGREVGSVMERFLRAGQAGNSI
ncbi:MAG TPA: hypothetical protein VGH23_01095 [Rhizomicrobium sp.]